MGNKKQLTGQARLDKSLEKVESWVHAFSGVRVFPDERVKKYIDNDDQVGIEYVFSALYENGMRNLGQALLFTSTDIQQAITVFSQSAKRRVASTGLETLFMKRSGRTISLPDDVTNNLLCAVATGQMTFAKQQFNIVNDAFKGGYGINPQKNWNDEWRYSAMGLTILGEFFDSPLNLDALGWPRDPAWMPLVQSWNSQDLAKVQAVLLDACDIHMERISLSSKETDSGHFDFSTPFLAVHPTEILAILRLREVLGLANPELDHPLMNTPYAKLTCGTDFKAEPDELLNALLNAVTQRDPDIIEHWNAAQA